MRRLILITLIAICICAGINTIMLLKSTWQFRQECSEPNEVDEHLAAWKRYHEFWKGIDELLEEPEERSLAKALYGFSEPKEDGWQYDRKTMSIQALDERISILEEPCEPKCCEENEMDKAIEANGASQGDLTPDTPKVGGGDWFKENP